MAFAAPTKSKQATTNLAKSTWTPMNNSEANLQVVNLDVIDIIFFQCYIGVLYYMNARD